MIDVPSQMTQAIETALGASLQHVIVDNEKDGETGDSIFKSNAI